MTNKSLSKNWENANSQPFHQNEKAKFSRLTTNFSLKIGNCLLGHERIPWHFLSTKQVPCEYPFLFFSQISSKWNISLLRIITGLFSPFPSLTHISLSSKKETSFLPPSHVVTLFLAEWLWCMRMWSSKTYQVSLELDNCTSSLV